MVVVGQMSGANECTVSGLCCEIEVRGGAGVEMKKSSLFVHCLISFSASAVLDNCRCCLAEFEAYRLRAPSDRVAVAASTESRRGRCL